MSCDCMVCLLAWLKVGEGVGGGNKGKKGGVRGRDGGCELEATARSEFVGPYPGFKFIEFGRNQKPKGKVGNLGVKGREAACWLRACRREAPRWGVRGCEAVRGREGA